MLQPLGWVWGCVTFGATAETVSLNPLDVGTPSWGSSPLCYPQHPNPMGILPSAEPRSFRWDPAEVTLPLSVPQHPKNTRPLPAALCPAPTLPKHFLTEQWDFWGLFVAFVFLFSSSLLVSGFVLGFIGQRSKRGLLISSNEGAGSSLWLDSHNLLTAYKLFRSGCIVGGLAVSLGTLSLWEGGAEFCY